ncbi:EGFlike domain containing protein [Acanthamoeba castellanii str. Neff]|uniref:EGFlike domain containing protein n=1 Tax=Acanthamoeba castellanii (strain ATCC 30010 / Neff) TaxID=1257118 RepID=L8GGD1_ACACF|nr:EGFlike domain containing protein [Acanthamoeba castellanii str. Neff]ELR11251.1 EGFlike domain containing protein [Acanthamoeba castellanii str. Neff]
MTGQELDHLGRLSLVGWLLVASLAFSGANYFAVGPTGSNYPGWQPYTWNSATLATFIQEYNTNSGIISCCFDVKWAGQSVVPYSTNGNPWCSTHYPSSNVVSLGTPGSWYMQINSGSVWPVTANFGCSGGLSFFVRTGSPPSTCNAYNCVHGTCVPQSGGTQQCQCSKGWYGSNCDMIVPPFNSSYFFVQFTWQNFRQGEFFYMAIDSDRNPDDCRWFIRGYPEDQTDGSSIGLSSFNAAPYEISFGTTEAVNYASMGVWMVTRKLTSGSVATCRLKFIMAPDTKGCLAQSGFLPICYLGNGAPLYFQLHQL